MRKQFLLTILLLSGCGVITQHPKVAAVSQPQVIIATKDTAKVISKLSEICDRDGLQIDETNPTNVSCSREAPIMAQAFLGTKYGTDVRSRIRFNAISLNKSTKVVGKAWFGNQTAFGQDKTYEVNGGEAQQLLMQILNDTKSELEGKTAHE